MAGSTKTNRTRRPPPITAELVEMGTDDVYNLNEGIVFCLKNQGCRRFPAWERKLLEDARDNPKPCLLYAREILAGDWPELEPLLVSDPLILEEYLSNIPGPLQHRPVLEKAILADVDGEPEDRARNAYIYADMVVKGRWEEGERVILEATRRDSQLVRDEAHEDLAKVVRHYEMLAFPKALWPELRTMIRNRECNPDFAVEYCIESLDNRGS